MMRIYAVADIHGRFDRIRRIASNLRLLKADLLVAAGDLTRFKESKKIVSHLDRLSVTCFGIRGNTDRRAVERWMGAYPDVHDLHMREQTADGIHFVGAGGTVPLPFRSRICLRENALLQKLAPMVNKETILVAHPPPYGTLDKALGRYHVGSRNLHRFIAETQPRLLICGHVHEDSGIGQIGNTKVVNCAMSKRCEGVLIVLDEKRISRVEVINTR
jgi:Icc-related predicted phosphoesterase